PIVLNVLPPSSDDTPLPQLGAPGGDTEARRRVVGEGFSSDADRSSDGEKQRGWVHSHETTSTVDGPGFRYVVWLAGCHLRCQYCHNPDTWALRHGKQLSAGEVLIDAARFAKYLSMTGGGFTVSGGEPLVQTSFAMQLLRGAKDALKLHTALDTNGYLGDRLSDDDLQAIDLVLLDLKAFDAEQHQRVTGFDNAAILAFARRLAEQDRPTWVRYVLVPELTDGRDDIAKLADFVAPMKNVQRVEVLPFHQMGRNKWHELGLNYRLDETASATEEQANAARNIFRDAGCAVV
ncbi:MAG: pyruvate formate-lyase-activating protein, partial [Planctomycetota bacterium]